VLLASDGGYGFVGKLSDLVSKNKAGKAALKPSKGGLVMPPLEVANYDETLLLL
jgi:topoisomerase-4 subunit A